MKALFWIIVMGVCFGINLISAAPLLLAGDYLIAAIPGTLALGCLAMIVWWAHDEDLR